MALESIYSICSDKAGLVHFNGNMQHGFHHCDQKQHLALTFSDAAIYFHIHMDPYSSITRHNDSNIRELKA